MKAPQAIIYRLGSYLPSNERLQFAFWPAAIHGTASSADWHILKLMEIDTGESPILDNLYESNYITTHIFLIELWLKISKCT